MQEIRPESLLMLAIIPIGFIAFAIFLIVGAIEYFSMKDKEKEMYENIAKQMNWNFSASGKGIESTKPYFEYINRRISPDRLRFGAFPVNILSGNIENTFFAVFDFNYNDNLGSKNYSVRCEKGILFVTKNLNLPDFEVVEKNVFSQGFDFVAGNPPSSNFNKNYQIKTNDRKIVKKLHAPEIAQMFKNSDIIRALSNSDFLCLFFRRNVEEPPNLSRIQYQLNTVWHLAKSLKK